MVPISALRKCPIMSRSRTLTGDLTRARMRNARQLRHRTARIALSKCTKMSGSPTFARDLKRARMRNAREFRHRIARIALPKCTKMSGSPTLTGDLTRARMRNARELHHRIARIALSKMDENVPLSHFDRRPDTCPYAQRARTSPSNCANSIVKNGRKCPTQAL